MSFADTARKGKKSSIDLEALEQIKAADLVAKYPEGVTVTAFTTLRSKKYKGDTAVLLFAEEPGKFCFFGSVFVDLCNKWAADYQNDFDAASAALQAEGGCKLHIMPVVSKDGNTYYDYEVL